MANGNTKDPNITEADPVIGTPVEDSEVFPGQQNYEDTCAIRSQQFIIEQFTGTPLTEEQLMSEASAHGWYTPGGGTPMEDVGNLLELHGIPVNRIENANIFNLANELAQGHKVIIGVDSGELWQEHPILSSIADHLGISGVDHAVVVSGIDTSDPEHVKVIVSDPGTGEAAATYPMEDFLDAWQDSGCYMVATQDPAPAHLPEMEHFDYDAGHIPAVGDVPFDEMQDLMYHPDEWWRLTETSWDPDTLQANHDPVENDPAHHDPGQPEKLADLLDDGDDAPSTMEQLLHELNPFDSDDPSDNPSDSHHGHDHDDHHDQNDYHDHGPDHLHSYADLLDDDPAGGDDWL
ncbi:hypothetical protein GTO89_12320 [Heliobacterium gestii]|uniref:Peptidase C39-like domain-containing protein n=1 Tax=Heliomicrobium gestii TaxID=2699 RepID=A0A845LK98_HELGE|nr:hypothetical protein [Heliomicrobium gestii]MBM7867267.1 hypothetical protein [Heliomicrobium gestii]MZP43823.1 hypothetical protein [Heliomicrobium gestii]